MRDYVRDLRHPAAEYSVKWAVKLLESRLSGNFTEPTSISELNLAERDFRELRCVLSRQAQDLQRAIPPVHISTRIASR